MAVSVLHVHLEGRGRPGEGCRCLAPLGGGAVSRGGNATPAAGSACSPPGRRRKASSEGSAQAASQEEPPPLAWQLHQYSVRAAALRR